MERENSTMRRETFTNALIIMSVVVGYALFAALCCTSCVNHKPSKEKEFKTVVIDSCEYLYSYEGVDEGALFTHKGNCKYCAERANHSSK